MKPDGVDVFGSKTIREVGKNIIQELFGVSDPIIVRVLEIRDLFR